MSKLVVALHDVTPAHGERLERAERLLEALGITAASYLFVPAFHGMAAAHESGDFVAWCRRSRPISIQWALHGYFHDERTGVTEGLGRLSPIEWLGSKVLTHREAEFLRLRGGALSARIDAGIASFERCIGSKPTAFVPPAWLFNDELLQALSARGFHLTESQLRLFHLPSGVTRRSPVITWATRSRLHRGGSIALAAARRRLCARGDVMRVALHPFDFDHPSTVASIARTLDLLRRDRVLVAYDAHLFG
jgi:predicted deacetylase